MTSEKLYPQDINRKRIEPLLIAYIDSQGDITTLNHDIDRIYEYLYSNNFGEFIAGPSMGIFYDDPRIVGKGNGRQSAAVPLKEKIEGHRDIHIKLLDGINCLSTIHTDSQTPLDESFSKIEQYCIQHNLKFLFPVRELYIPIKIENETRYQTEIQVPVKY